MRRLSRPIASRAAGRLLLAAAFLGAATIAGCIAAPFLRASQLKGSHTVPPKYTDLAQKSFAVVVIADRMTQADFAQLVPQMTTRISERLREHCLASGWVPPPAMLQYQYQNPRWSTMSHREIGKELEVDRLVVVEVQEFRLNEPGNQFQWQGLSSGIVGVVEMDADTEAFAFQESYVVRFPTKEQAITPDKMDAVGVASVLLSRVVDRCAWMFYEHTEPNVIDY